MNKLLWVSLFTVLVANQIVAQSISVKETDASITVSNNIVSFSFNKANADLTQIGFEKYTNILGKKGRGYLLGPGFSMLPAKFSIIRKTDSLIELSFFHEADNHFQYDLHYVLRSNESGIYCFLYQSHEVNTPLAFYGQTRWGLSADEKLFNYHLVRDSIQGPMPAMSELTESNKIQDWTYRMPDSTYYTKYDYADYIENRHVHGFAGTHSGLGIFTIQASHEYLNGGPTKQFQNVHSTPYLINMFNCGHFLSDKRKGDDSITNGWGKLSGPFFLYVNSGKNIDAIWNDAKAQSQKQIAQWPYAWMQHPNYPLKDERGELNGKLTIPAGKLTANAHIILAAPGSDWQAQSQGYIYYTRADADGRFQINNIRAGNYCMYAYTDNVTEEFVKENIVIRPKVTTLLGTIVWTPTTHGTKLWQLGVADRTTKGFKLSDHKRNYGLFNLPPANLEFTIGKSKEQEDWYYAQTKQGNWNIIFNTNAVYKGKATLTIAIAGCAKNPRLDVAVNNKVIGTLYMGNDASVYRSAVAGGYYQKEELQFPASLLAKGTNTISLRLPNVKPGGGIMYDAIKLEVK